MNKERISFKAQAFSGSVDKENRTIKEVVLIEPNREASGHGLFVDDFMVNQVVELGSQSEVGFKARFDHPNACTSAMGTQLGRLKNFKLKGGKAVADLHIGEFTKDAPGGDMGKWLLSVAAEDPDQVGFSIVFSQAEPEMFEAGEGDDADSPEFLYPHARIGAFHGADIVDEGAATSSLFEDGIVGRPNYMAEQAVLFVKEKEDLFRTALEPLITKMFNENINQKSINMSDNKPSLLERITNAVKTEFSAEVVEETTDVVEEVVEEDAKDIALASKDAEILSLSEDFEVKVAEFTKESEDKDVLLSEAKTAIEALSAEVEELRNVSLGTTVEPVANTDESVELSDEAKAKAAESNHFADKMAWIKEGFGNAVS
jgi:hypothetical protein